MIKKTDSMLMLRFFASFLNKTTEYTLLKISSSSQCDSLSRLQRTSKRSISLRRLQPREFLYPSADFEVLPKSLSSSHRIPRLPFVQFLRGQIVSMPMDASRDPRILEASLLAMFFDSSTHLFNQGNETLAVVFCRQCS
ncbi:hypothetical protein L596_027475 [Steinernema carpocapsae]|uniref:Uncharacterized protein n=1 Tax=Steinernema carpocapsae TaxID=34508 RepID=A0A4U5LVL9_STECR|nr:hypothetical protein L596_027475 [Steinernema carpocapsae]